MQNPGKEEEGRGKICEDVMKKRGDSSQDTKAQAWKQKIKTKIQYNIHAFYKDFNSPFFSWYMYMF